SCRGQGTAAGSAGAALTLDGGLGQSLTTSSGTTTSFGTLDVCCTLAVTSGGAVSQTGAVTVGSVTTINAAAQTIALTNAGNDFAGAVNVTGGTTSITDSNALTFGTVN